MISFRYIINRYQLLSITILIYFSLGTNGEISDVPRALLGLLPSDYYAAGGVAINVLPYFEAISFVVHPLDR